MHLDLLVAWLPELRRRMPIHLETNGVMHEALAAVRKHVDSIAMDIKLPSSTGIDNLWDCHAAFLQKGVDCELFVKAVVSETTEDWEIERTSSLIADVRRSIPLFLQPVTRGKGQLAPGSFRLLEMQEIASRYLPDVRVVPQTHLFLDLL